MSDKLPTRKEKEAQTVDGLVINMKKIQDVIVDGSRISMSQRVLKDYLSYAYRGGSSDMKERILGVLSAP